MFWDKNGIGTVPVGDGAAHICHNDRSEGGCGLLGIVSRGDSGTSQGGNNHSMSSLGVSISVVGRCR